MPDDLVSPFTIKFDTQFHPLILKSTNIYNNFLLFPSKSPFPIYKLNHHNSYIHLAIYLSICFINFTTNAHAHVQPRLSSTKLLQRSLLLAVLVLVVVLELEAVIATVCDHDVPFNLPVSSLLSYSILFLSLSLTLSLYFTVAMCAYIHMCYVCYVTPTSYYPHHHHHNIPPYYILYAPTINTATTATTNIIIINYQYYLLRK